MDEDVKDLLLILRDQLAAQERAIHELNGKAARLACYAEILLEAQCAVASQVSGDPLDTIEKKIRRKIDSLYQKYLEAEEDRDPQSAAWQDNRPVFGDNASTDGET